MAWECGCGISNPHEALRCAGCGISKEESQQYLFDVQTGKYPKTIGKHKWGEGRIILLDIVGSMIVVGLSQNESSTALIVLISLFIVIVICPSGD